MIAEQLNRYIEYCGANINTGNGLIIGLFIIGLVGGFTHCTAMAAFGAQTLIQKFPDKMAVVQQGMMIWSGLWLFAMGGMMIFERIGS